MMDVNYLAQCVAQQALNKRRGSIITIIVTIIITIIKDLCRKVMDNNIRQVGWGPVGKTLIIPLRNFIFRLRVLKKESDMMKMVFEDDFLGSH